MFSIFKKLKARKQEKLNHLRRIKREELFQKVRAVVCKELDIEDKETVKLTSRFKEDLGVDSLSTIELTMGLEDAFQIELPDEQVEKSLTVGDVVDYLEKIL